MTEFNDKFQTMIPAHGPALVTGAPAGGGSYFITF